MSAASSPRRRSAIVARLRAAGCVYAEEEARLLLSAAVTPTQLADMLDRRTAGDPLEHVLGWAEFCGLRMAVDPGVFVPRPRTAFLAREAARLACLARARQRPIVVDLCCGSGAVGAAVAAIVDRIDLYAVDIDPAAVRCARRNLGAVGEVFEGDLYEPLPAALQGAVDIVVANAPYVPTEAIGLLPPEARLHEPRAALDGGADGLDVLRRVVAAAPRWLAEGGHLLVETSERQVPPTVGLINRNGMTARVARSDEMDASIVIGTRPSRRRPGLHPLEELDAVGRGSRRDEAIAESPAENLPTTGQRQEAPGGQPEGTVTRGEAGHVRRLPRVPRQKPRTIPVTRRRSARPDC